MDTSHQRLPKATARRAIEASVPSWRTTYTISASKPAHRLYLSIGNAYQLALLYARPVPNLFVLIVSYEPPRAMVRMRSSTKQRQKVGDFCEFGLPTGVVVIL